MNTPSSDLMAQLQTKVEGCLIGAMRPRDTQIAVYRGMDAVDVGFGKVIVDIAKAENARREIVQALARTELLKGAASYQIIAERMGQPKNFVLALQVMAVAKTLGVCQIETPYALNAPRDPNQISQRLMAGGVRVYGVNLPPVQPIIPAPVKKPVATTPFVSTQDFIKQRNAMLSMRYGR